MSRSFLGRGWKYPVEVDRSGGVAAAEFEESIRQSLLIILGTAPGERVMRPAFGCHIHDLLFSPNTLATSTVAAEYCVESLSKWEPRIQDVEAEAQPSEDDPNRMDITIKYRVRATNTSRNLVYPFYIRRSDEQ